MPPDTVVTRPTGRARNGQYDKRFCSVIRVVETQGISEPSRPMRHLIDPESTAKICQVGDDGVARWEFNPHKSKGGSETEVLHMCKISGGINPLKRMNRKP